MKLRSKRFSKKIDKFVEKFNSSIHIDKQLYKEDIECSIAHAKMLSKTNIISQKEKNEIVVGLRYILKNIENGKIKFNLKNEDIHINIEALLINKIGVVGKKLHTARSRNDQIATDLKLYSKKNIIEILKLLKEFLSTIIMISKKNITTIMPGYTHLQKAQAITFAYHLMAYFEMFKRDYTRAEDALNRLDVLPLGSCALAGTSFPIDRKYVQKLLGFKYITLNGLDAVSDRDFVVETESFCSLIMIHLSRLCEEIILWNNDEFKFINIDDAYVTGSSIMPQKKNPDVAELIRGKSGRVVGHLVAMLITLKGLPLSYNKDMQEDKEGFFDTLNTIKNSLRIIRPLISKMTINKQQMENKTLKGFLNATDIADYLTKKGIPFRDSYHIAAEIINKCSKEKKLLKDLKLEEYKSYSKMFNEDIYTYIDILNSINNKKSIGSTSEKQIKQHLLISQKWLSKI